MEVVIPIVDDLSIPLDPPVVMQHMIILLQFILMSNSTNLVVVSQLKWQQSCIQLWEVRQRDLRQRKSILSSGIWDRGESWLIMLGLRGQGLSLKNNCTNN